MSTRTTIKTIGRQRGTEARRKFAGELRDARLALGVSQAEAAKRVGVDRSYWGKVELLDRDVSIGRAAMMAAAVGLDLRLNLYPADRLPRDHGHLRLGSDSCRLVGPGYRWRFEVSIASGLDRRAWDAVATHLITGFSFVMELETVLRDIQALLRRVHAKQAACGNPRVVLMVRASKANRLAVKAAEDILRAAFPVPARTALSRLRAGLDPGGDALILVDWGRGDDRLVSAVGV